MDKLPWRPRSDGVTQAKLLLTETEPGGISPNISVPVRARPQQ